MFYNRIKKYNDVSDASKEINRAIKLCIDEMDQENESRINHKIHILGQFLSGSEVLISGIDGYFKHRVKSIISINPLFISFENSILNWAKSRIHLVEHIEANIDVNFMSNNIENVEFLKKNNISFNKINSFLYRYLQKSIKRLKSPRYLNNFTVKNLLIIHSVENVYKDRKALKNFVENVFIENLEVFELEKGQTELLIEDNEIYSKLLKILLNWLKLN